MIRPANSRAVIWDMDGVICDSGDCHHLAWNRVMARWGIAVSEEVFRSGFGTRTDAFIRCLVGDMVPEAHIQKIALFKERFFRRIARGHIEPLPGVVPLLGSLRSAGYRMALASSAPLANIRLTIHELDITVFFEAVVSGDDVTDGKPSPQIFRLAAQKLGVYPRDCLVIEDAAVGVTAAHRAGMAALAVTNTLSARQLGMAEKVVGSLTDVNLDDIEAIFEKSKGAGS
ncbi:MAG: HAD family phosphatase [Dehalococcoidia bacterium]|nr:MAG: HAD family phosphatase [Dehalococcoidia bacterium]